MSVAMTFDWVLACMLAAHLFTRNYFAGLMQLVVKLFAPVPFHFNSVLDCDK